jgi:hypothetical protein
MEYVRPLGFHKKMKPLNQIMAIEEGEEIQIKCIDNLFDNVIEQTSLILRKGGTSRNRGFSEFQTSRIRKKPYIQTYCN